MQLDANLIAHRLEARYGLGLSGYLEEIDGGKFSVVRPNDIPRPNGFGIVIARTPRQIEASFKADTFSRGLLRHMSEADDVARSNFDKLASRARSNGFRICISIDGNPVDSLSQLTFEEWAKFELDCDSRLPGGKLSSDELHKHALEVSSVCLGMTLCLLPVEEVADSVAGFEEGLPEGAKIRVEVNKYERSPVNRAACISHYGAVCQSCGFDFGSFYGDIGLDFIEVHHRVPVSAMGGEYRIDPVEDLVPVCGNCHAMLHRSDPPISIEKLREIIAKQKKNPPAQ